MSNSAITDANTDAKCNFPFSAVVGQDHFKQALILVAINPSIGGVVISGPRGSAKSTLARGLAGILQSESTFYSESKMLAEFVTLPLGATEEMLLGSLNLEKALNKKEVSFKPGLLSKAHGGVLYVDEVNLLPDNLIDQLLDVAASGMNVVERDGISHQHAAEFILLGTMNPDEGELRQQLHDRFGLAVELSSRYPIKQRVEIVKAREAFDVDPEGFIERYEEEQNALLKRIALARKTLSSVTCDDSIRVEIAERCDRAKVDGLRADIVWLRSAIAQAAWRGNDVVELSDVDAVEEFVLCHRRNAQSDNTPSGKGDGSSDQGGNSQRQHGGAQQFKRPANSQRRESHQKGEGAEPTSQGDWGSMLPQVQHGIERPESTLLEYMDRHFHAEHQLISPKPRATSPFFGKRKGRLAAGTNKGAKQSDKPDWYGTLLNNFMQWPPQKLQYKKEKQGQLRLHLVLLDTSASTLEKGVFAKAKGILSRIAEQAYIKREQISVLGFGNNEVKPLLAKVRAPKELDSWLATLGAGGGTPLREGADEAVAYARRLVKQFPGIKIHTYIVSDGRSSASLEGICFPGDVAWIDVEQAAIKRGRGAFFASQIGAFYFSLNNETNLGGFVA